MIQVFFDFMDKGGEVLWILAFHICILLVLIFYKALSFYLEAPIRIRNLASLNKHNLFMPEHQEKFFLSKEKDFAKGGLSWISLMVQICPLLGLLGTVVGMVSVFDVMAFEGSGNARAMAAGISKATIPTMAGMVGALVGLYFENSVKLKSKKYLALASQVLQRGLN